MSACECSPCGRLFTGVGPFDRHQDVDYNRRPAVRCLDPAELGMVQNKHGRWGFAPDADSEARLSKMRAEQAPPGINGRVR